MSSGPSFHTCLWWDLASIQSCDQCQSNKPVNSFILSPLLCQHFWTTIFSSWGSFKFLVEVLRSQTCLSLFSRCLSMNRCVSFPLLWCSYNSSGRVVVPQQPQSYTTVCWHHHNQAGFFSLCFLMSWELMYEEYGVYLQIKINTKP